MIGNPFQGGLLGMGGLDGLAPEPQGLLGQYYDQDAVRKATIKNMLMLGGLGLMGGGWEGAAKGAATAAISTPNQYRDMAMDAFQMDQSAQDQAWQDEQRARERDAWGREDAAYAGMPEDVRKYYDMGGQGLASQYIQATDPAFQTAQGDNNIFGTMYWDENGNPYVLDQGGNMRRPNGLPEGTKLMTPEEKAAAQSRGRVMGTGQGDAGVTYESMKAKLPGVQSVIAEMDDLAEKATYTMTGQAYDAIRKEFGAEPREAAIARQEYIAKARNQVFPMLRDTFGAQFTQAEGQALLATMGDPNMSPQEKQAVLKAKIEQYVRDMEAQGIQAGRAPATDAGTGQVRRRYNPATGRVE